MTFSTISLTLLRLRNRGEIYVAFLKCPNCLQSTGLPLLYPLLLACWYGAINRFAEREMPLGRRIQVEHFLSPTSRDHACRCPVAHWESFLLLLIVAL